MVVVYDVDTFAVVALEALQRRVGNFVGAAIAPSSSDATVVALPRVVIVGHDFR